MKIHHLNCGLLHAPPNPPASCHCLLLEQAGQLVLIDTGLGLQDIAQPMERIGPETIAAAGFQFHEHLTALRQIERLGFKPSDVTDIVLTHGDPDHAGGLADFPNAAVHVSAEEHSAIKTGGPRYSPLQFAHGPRWVVHSRFDEPWLGISVRPLQLLAGSDIFLVPLPGHTRGHCGVAVREEDRWLMHVGDAYYLKAELTTDDHPVSALASVRAQDDRMRRESLALLRRLAQDHGEQVQLIGYHDFSEFPS